MIYDKVTMAKTAEGTYNVSLINNHIVVAVITFPTSVLAQEYAEFKIKAESGPTSKATKSVIADFKGMVANDAHEKVMDAFYEKTGTPTIAVATTETEPQSAQPVVKVERQAAPVVEAPVVEAPVVEAPVVPEQKTKVPFHIDTSAKVGKNPTIDTSAKVGKSAPIDVSAKTVAE
jgi:ribonuclease E